MAQTPGAKFHCRARNLAPTECLDPHLIVELCVWSLGHRVSTALDGPNSRCKVPMPSEELGTHRVPRSPFDRGTLCVEFGPSSVYSPRWPKSQVQSSTAARAAWHPPSALGQPLGGPKNAPPTGSYIAPSANIKLKTPDAMWNQAQMYQVPIHFRPSPLDTKGAGGYGDVDMVFQQHKKQKYSFGLIRPDCLKAGSFIRFVHGFLKLKGFLCKGFFC